MVKPSLEDVVAICQRCRMVKPSLEDVVAICQDTRTRRQTDGQTEADTHREGESVCMFLWLL